MSTMTRHTIHAPWNWRLWGQWILANAISEMLGLGAAFLIGIFLLVQAEPALGAVAPTILGVLAATAIEGSLVGTAQWLVLRRPLPKLHWYVWVGATALGAGIAWTLGMLPSTVLFAGPESTTAAPGPMSDLVIYALAAALGLAAGATLSIPQGWVLRQYVPKASWWVLANALAWMLGMVVIFLGTSFIPAGGITWPIAVLLMLFVAMAGALVGAIHGLFLIWLLRWRRSQAAP